MAPNPFLLALCAIRFLSRFTTPTSGPGFCPTSSSGYSILSISANRHVVEREREGRLKPLVRDDGCWARSGRSCWGVILVPVSIHLDSFSLGPSYHAPREGENTSWHAVRYSSPITAFGTGLLESYIEHLILLVPLPLLNHDMHVVNSSVGWARA